MNKKVKWQHLSIEAPPELIESIADVFTRYAVGKVVIASINIQDEIDGQGKVSGPMRVSAYLQMDKYFADKKNKIEHAIASLALIQKIPDIQYENIHEENWMESWKKNFKALKIGKKFLIQPAWLEPEQSSRYLIRIDPGMAFGTGVHPSTQLALSLLEESVASGMSLFDIGCGSGILSISAEKLGAGPIIGIDIDAAAIENANDHGQLNQSMAIFARASIKDIAQGEFEFRQADVVVANILATILVKLLEEGLAGLVSPGGRLILSGILIEQEDEIEIALAKQNFHSIQKISNEDWIAIKAVKG